MENIQVLWNNRAQLLGDSQTSVMEQSFPRVVNDAIARIHLKEIASVLPNGTVRCLDVGCGWGRIASDLVRNHPHVSISGIDLSEHFVKFFNRRLKGKGEAKVADMQKIPFRAQTFDVVYCVVSFMYLSSKIARKRALTEMLRVLKKEGALVLIEPNKHGVDLVRLWGLVPYLYRLLTRRVKLDTHGAAFYPAEIERLISISGGIIVQRRTYPFFSIMLLPLIIIGTLVPSVASIIIPVARIFDRLLPIRAPSYFITWVVRRKM